MSWHAIWGPVWKLMDHTKSLQDILQFVKYNRIFLIEDYVSPSFSWTGATSHGLHGGKSPKLQARLIHVYIHWVPGKRWGISLVSRILTRLFKFSRIRNSVSNVCHEGRISAEERYKPSRRRDSLKGGTVINETMHNRFHIRTGRRKLEREKNRPLSSAHV